MATKAKPKAKRRAASATLHKERFPGEGRNYRAARDALLKAELTLRRKIESVAALRRKLPPGGPVPEDYEFEEGGADPADTQTVRRVKMSELFRRDASLVIYSYMYGPAMAKPCPMCTCMLDSLDGAASHAGRRARGAGVDRADRRARVRRAQHSGVRLVGQVHITDIAAAPGDKAAVLDARNGLSYCEVGHADHVYLLLEPAMESTG